MNDFKKSRKIVFLLFSKTHLLDLGGPAQVFYEANQIGNLNLKIIFASQNPQVVSEQKLRLSGLQSPDNLKLSNNDFVIIPGIDFASFKRGELQKEVQEMQKWLKRHKIAGVKIATICSGALILAEAGMLNGYSCTSHWKCIDFIKEHYPDINIYSNRLFVKDRNIYTSAGMTSGMDMSLAILEELYGPILTSKVAREMVIFLRRDKDNSQESVYLEYQTHFNPAIHKVQDYIISHPAQNPGLDTLSGVANMSERNLTRTFKDVTGHTITEFKHEVKLSLAKTFLNNPSFTVNMVAQKCGFSDPRQLRRIWKKKVGGSISNYRKNL
jgi:transcriptional regulator GlxA family with amidase domain